MKALSIALLASAGLFVTGTAAAADGAALAKAKGCLACHTVDKKVIGPAFKEVSAKYKGDATAEAKLVQKVKKGGSGVWGPSPMPPHAHVSDADITTIVKWVMAQ